MISPAAELSGVWATALLPIEPDESIDWGRLDEDLAYLVAAAPHGIYVNGSAGEFATLSESEFDRIGEALASRCVAAGVRFQIGASHPSGQLSLERIRRARALRPDAIQVVLPDWLPLAEEEVLAALARMAEAADGVPLVLYNPPHAKTVVAPALYARIAAEVPSLIGIKIGSGSEEWHAAMRELAPGIAVFVAGHLLARELPLGARGSYSNIACLSPRGAAEWLRLAREGDPLAAELDRRTTTFFEEAVRPLGRAGYSPVALDKLLAAIGGWSRAGLALRWPMRAVPEERVAPARERARELIGELLLG